jgi:uncharacterized protein (DUF1015 family)
MAVIKPFKGLLYNPELVNDFSNVTAPPYDVISPELQETLYKRHPNNVVRLILPTPTPGDRPGSDRYSRAAGELNKWIDGGVLTRDRVPAIYYYTQDYALKDGGKRRRRGFIALARLEELGKGGIMPHERTLSGPKADRLSLMKACNANLSCIFTLYPESEKEKSINSIIEGAASGGPLIEVTGDDGVVNRLWRIDDPGVIGRVTEALEDKPLFIADGHHRYETALNFRKMMRETRPDATREEPFNYVMMYFTALDDEGLDIFPTHRVIHDLEGFDGVEFIKRCERYFYIDEMAFEQRSEPAVREDFFRRMGKGENTRLGLFIREGSSYITLTLKSNKTMDELFGDSIPDEYKALDVTVLHALVLDKILGITPGDQEKQKNIIYVKGVDEAVKAGSEWTNQMVFFMNPTKVEQVRAVSEAGLLMPQKSTYFFPKLLTGLVINRLG